MAIAFQDLAELMAMALARDRGTGGDHVAVLEKKLSDRAGVVPSRLERFDVRQARGREHLSVRCAAVAVLVGEAAGREQRPAVAAVPEQPRTHHRSLVAGQIRPRIVIDVGRLLPVAAAEQRRAPAAGQRR